MTTDRTDDDSNSFTFLTFKSVILRSFDNTLDSRLATFKVEMYQEGDIPKKEFSMLMEKTRLWFSSVITNSLMFSVNNTYAFKCIFEDGIQVSDNYPMVCPGEPTDEMIAMLVQAKLNAFAADIPIAFGSVEIETYRPPEEMVNTIYAGFSDEDLPTMSDWIGEVAYHSVPWWNRNDGTTIDILPSEDDDLTEPPQQGFDMACIENQYKEKAALVVSPSAFKPQVIECKTDEHTD